MDPLIGKVLNGRFRVIEKLGAGGMGTVYKAVQSPLDRLVALKVLNSNYDSRRDPGFQRRFFLEASVTSKLRHPNTITVIDYGKTDDGIYFIAMEYVEGITLAQVLTQEGTVPWSRVLNIGQQVARSLREAHKSGIIHRDLKPANVMICNEETDHDLVKVLDFGLVKSFIPDSAHPVEEGPHITQAGVFLGSPQYMAPEQARNLADPRSDIYSLGIVMYQMLIGQPPFYAEQSIDVIVKHMKEPPRPFGSARPDLAIPAEIEALVMKCLEKSPDKRYQSMDELLEAMRGAAQSAGISGTFSGVRTSQSGAHRIQQSGPQRMLPGSGAYRMPAASQSGVRSQVGSGVHKVNTGVHRGINSGPLRTSGAHLKTSAPHPKVSAPHPRVSGAHKAELAAHETIPEMPLEEGLEAESDTESDILAISAPRQGLKLLPLWIVLGVVAAGGILFLVLRPHPGEKPVQEQMAQNPPPQHTPKPPAPTPGDDDLVVKLPSQPSPEGSPETAQAPIRVHVQSEPTGAIVMHGSREVGRTPTTFELPPGPNGSIQEPLTLTLNGYLLEKVVASGRGPEIFIHQQLRKKTIAPPVKPKRPPNTGHGTGYKDDPYQ